MSREKIIEIETTCGGKRNTESQRNESRNERKVERGGEGGQGGGRSHLV